jgi:predicted metal-dependent phosphoesterase TrpH
VGRADLHIHSAVGDGLAAVAAILAFAQESTDLDLIAITDHDEVRGALQAREMVAGGRYRFDVVLGTEITTRQGHLLAYGVERRYRMLRSLRDSIAEVHDDGGFVVVPHPLSPLTHSAGATALRRLVLSGDARVRPDGIEMFNPSIAARVTQRRAARLNDETLRLSATGGSDAHHLNLIGTGATEFPGRTADDFRAALGAGTTRPTGHWWTAADHLQGFAEQQLRSLVLAPGHKLLRALRSE